MNVVMAWVFMQGLGLFLFCYWGTHFVGVWGPKDDCNAVVVGGFFTLWNHSVALVCSEVSQRLFKVALQLIKYFKSNICLEMGKKFTIKFDLHCFIFQPEKFIVVTTCTDYGNNSFVCLFLIRLMCFQISWSHLNKILTFHSIEMPVVSVT